MKINIGCGDHPIDGWLNIDLVPPADIVADFRHVGFSNVEEINMSHVLEHLGWRETQGALVHAWEWLKPGGIITVEVPDSRELLDAGVDHPMWLWGVYGAQIHEGEYHKSGFTMESLETAMADAHFDIVSKKEFLSGEDQRPGFPCIEIVGRKPE